MIRLYILVFHLFVMQYILSSEQSPFIQDNISLLELCPGKGLEKVILPYPYYHMTKQDKESLFLMEGNYTILETNQCALIGPLRPCQLFFLEIPTTPSQTLVAHIAAASQFLALLTQIKQEYAYCNLAQATGTLFTTYYRNYDNNTLELVDDSPISFKELYNNKSQLEELNSNKQLICNTFNIPNANIKTLFFIDEPKDFELSLYHTVSSFIFVKDGKLFNTYPFIEDYREKYIAKDTFLLDKHQAYLDWLNEKAKENLFFVQPEVGKWMRTFGYPPYNSLPFIKK